MGWTPNFVWSCQYGSAPLSLPVRLGKTGVFCMHAQFCETTIQGGLRKVYVMHTSQHHHMVVGVA